MIEVNHITKRFGKVTAVDDFTLDINRGSVLGIVGSNGGGKSTLLRILSGVFDADSGEVKINGQNIYNNPSVKGECFFIPDFPYFSNSATLENTAYLYRSLYPNWNRFSLSLSSLSCDVFTPQISTFPYCKELPPNLNFNRFCLYNSY